VAGLFWLHEGENVVGSDPLSDVVLPARSQKRAGVLTFKAGQVAFAGGGAAPRTLKPDDPGPPDVVDIGGVALTIIVRGGRTGVRLRDPQARSRAEFTGNHWYPVNEKWRVQSKWHASPTPKTIAITNILGMVTQEPSPGYAEFVLGGQTLRLDAVIDEGELFFLFKDATSGHATYGAGRFLHAQMPTGPTVELDFNKSYNPPCAFTAFATCPLPPKQNVLPVALEAGEKNYGNH
jgi:uncharacterized protein (DUF1684 family)